MVIRPENVLLDRQQLRREERNVKGRILVMVAAREGHVEFTRMSTLVVCMFENIRNRNLKKKKNSWWPIQVTATASSPKQFEKCGSQASLSFEQRSLQRQPLIGAIASRDCKPRL